MTGDPVFRAIRISRAELEQSQHSAIAISTAETEAERILAEANATAKRVLSKAEATRRDQSDLLKKIADKELKKFIDQEAINRSAEAFAEVLEQAAAIRRDFDAVTPWLTDFVEGAIRRILGTLPDEEVVARIVRQGVADLKHDGSLVLRAHVEDSDRVRDAMDQFPRYFEPVRELRCDVEVPRGTLVLKGQGGSIRIDLTSQLDALTGWLRQEIANDRSAKLRGDT